MMREITQTIHCSYCNGDSFNLLETDSGIRLLQCTKCECVRDITAVSEDAKHNSYHEYGVEPHDKPVRDIF